MKTCLVFIMLTILALPAQDADRAAWRWQQAVAVESPGLIRLNLPPPTLDASQPSLADLRLISPDGVQTPYLIDQPQPLRSREHQAAEFSSRIIGRSTVLEAATDVRESIEAIALESASGQFLKPVRVEAAKSGGDWEEIAPSEVIFRQSGGAARLEIPVPADDWERLRVTIDDSRTLPVPFTGIRVTLAGTRPETVRHTVTLGPREESASGTRLALDLGAGNLHLAGLQFDVSDPLFSRGYSLAFRLPSEGGEPIERTIATGTLYRVAAEEGSTAEQLAVPVHARIPSRSLILTIDNGDSPPLGITAAEASRYPTTLVFFAPQAGDWTLLTGNRQAGVPRYDIAALRAELDKARGTRIEPGPLIAKTDFQPPPALPGIAPAGAEIDLADWGFRRAVGVASTGVIEIRPDALSLARSRTDLGDLRVIQAGRQIPYLLMPAADPRLIAPGVEHDPDPERPRVSRWKITLPFEGLPATELRARSSAPLFTRTFHVVVDGRDHLGNPWTRTIGSATWTKSGLDAAEEESGLVLALNGHRLPQTFYLETDHGDNPPIPIEDVTIHYGVPSLVLKLTDPAPLFLYYGNPRAAPPSYDLRLVRSELLAADKLAATLGQEELLRPETLRRHRDVDAGSPWLWLALGLIVAVLLVIVAKLLPRGDASQSDGPETSG